MSRDISAGRVILPDFPKFVLGQMAPPRWTTTEQYEFLVGYIPTFLDYTAKNKQPKFWALLNNAWFARWPEIDELIAQELLPADASAQNRSDDGSQYKFSPAEQTLYKNALEARKNVSVLAKALLPIHN
jgi:hypothetical protein